jgi:photosystem II stability/assembly factor-like uncharacterized protein
VVGGTRTVRITVDGGASWTVACFPEGIGGWVRGLTLRGRRAWAVAGTEAQPVMIRSTDGGQTWSATPMPVQGFLLTDLAFLDEDHGWIVGSRPATDTGFSPVNGGGGIVFRTVDGGQTWEVAHDFPFDQVGRLNRVAFVDASHGFTFGLTRTGQPVLLATDDAGTTWAERTVPGGISEVRDLVFVDPQRSWLLGIAYDQKPDGSRPTVAIVMASNDGGATWAEQRRTVEMNVFDLDFTDAENGFFVGDRNGSSWLVSTSDGGGHWNEAAVPGRAVTAIDFTDPRHGWIGGMQGACLRVTSDGGSTWASRLIDGAPNNCS